MDEMNQEELRLDRYIAAIWRAKWLIIFGVIAAAAIAYFISSRQPTLHRATAQLKVGRVWKEQLQDPYITERIINSPAFLKETAEKTGANPRQLRQAINAETVIAGPRRSRYPLLVNITATAEKSDDAVSFAKAVADEMKARHDKLFDEAMKPHREQELRLEQRRNELMAQGNASRDLALKVEDELNEVRANNSSATITEKTELITDVVADGTIRPSIWRNVAAAAFIAAVALTVVAALAVHIKPAERRAAAGNQS